MSIPLIGLVPTASAAVEAPGDDLASRFTLAVIPDTQFYSRYAPQFDGNYGTNPYFEQTAWLAENQDALNIPIAVHLGDVVDQVNQPAEWEVADTAMRTLEDAGLPYSIQTGNHDVLDATDTLYDTGYDLAAEPYLRYFGPERAAQQSSFIATDPTGLNQYHIVEAEGQEFAVLALAWRASDATIAWANQVIADHPTVPVILTQHSLISIDTDQTTALETEYGLKLWNELIARNDQIFLTLNGHFHGAAKQTKLNDFGHEVTQVVIDYQMAYEGGNGYLGLYEFDLSNNVINVLTASPWVVAKPTETLTAYDQAFLEGPNQQFTVPVDFVERFAAFAPDFTAGEPTHPSLSQAARDILLDGFVEPPPVSTEEPGSVADFPEVDGTLAHWRFNGHDGEVEEGEVFDDIAGDNDLHRVSIEESGSTTAQVADVTVTSDAQPLSSDGAGICFANSDKREGRLSYLSTAADAPINAEEFPDGYTIETFLKIDTAWTEDANAWMKALAHSGNRSRIADFAPTRYDYTAAPVALGLSNLREFQLTEVPGDASKGDKTNWSGEILVDNWWHVALVNDPETAMTTMFVDGAPVLRVAEDTVGHSISESAPWLLGTDWVDDTATNGWAGCIGETRLIDHPTEPDEWLTARADLTGLTVDSVSDDAVVDSIDAVNGTGLPGAEVAVTVTADSADSSAAPVLAAASVDVRAVVADDGSWSVDFGGALAPGSYAMQATQSLGTRSADPIGVRFQVAGDVTDPGEGPGTPGSGDGGQDEGDDGPGTGDGAGDESDAAGSDGSLAFTGTEAILPVSIALLLLLAGTTIAIARRRRTTDNG